MRVPFKILGVEHIGFASKEAETLCSFFKENLGLTFTDEEVVSTQQTRTFFFQCENNQNTRLEVLEPSSPGLGPIASFLAKKGAGIHHVAFRVDNLKAALAFLESRGVDLIDKVPREGAHKSQVAFIHPKACGGILIELVE